MFKIKERKIENTIKQRLIQDLQRNVAPVLETEIKRRTPVDTGRLRASFQNRGTVFGAEVFSDVDYAKYVEYGTSRFTARAMMRRGAEEVARLGLKLLRNIKKPL